MSKRRWVCLEPQSTAGISTSATLVFPARSTHLVRWCKVFIGHTRWKNRLSGTDWRKDCGARPFTQVPSSHPSSTTLRQDQLANQSIGSFYMHSYIYIHRERERRERNINTYIYIYTYIHIYIYTYIHIYIYTYIHIYIYITNCRHCCLCGCVCGCGIVGGIFQGAIRWGWGSRVPSELIKPPSSPRDLWKAWFYRVPISKYLGGFAF